MFKFVVKNEPLPHRIDQIQHVADDLLDQFLGYPPQERGEALAIVKALDEVAESTHTEQ